MKKNYFLTFLGMCLLLLGSGSAFGQSAQAILDLDEDGGGLPYAVNIRFEIHAANLVYGGTDPVFGTYYVLPSNVPSMNLYYEVDDGVTANNYTVPLTQFYPTSLANKYLAFHEKALGNNCPIGGYNIYCALRTDANTSYPANKYGGTGEIFDCSYFSNVPFCQGPSADPIEGSLTVGFVCSPQNALEQLPQDNNTEEGRATSTEDNLSIDNALSLSAKQDNSTSLEVMPVPANNEVFLKHNLADAASVAITVYSSSGNLIYEQQTSAEEGIFNHTIIKNWTPGYYFGAMNINGTVEYFRLVKID